MKAITPDNVFPSFCSNHQSSAEVSRQCRLCLFIFQSHLSAVTTVISLSAFLPFKQGFNITSSLAAMSSFTFAERPRLPPSVLIGYRIQGFHAATRMFDHPSDPPSCGLHFIHFICHSCIQCQLLLPTICWVASSTVTMLLLTERCSSL